jgi:hypothetical protein
MGIDVRIAAASVDAEQYKALAQAFPSSEDRDIIVRAMEEPLPSPLAFALVAAKRKVASLVDGVRKVGAANG